MVRQDVIRQFFAASAALTLVSLVEILSIPQALHADDLPRQQPVHDLQELRFDESRPQRAGEVPKSTLWLDVHDFLDRQKHTVTPLFRELARQSLLIAAREELGLTTRDVSLREYPPTERPDQSRILELDAHPVVSADAERKVRFGITVFRQASPAPNVLWSGTLPAQTAWPASWIPSYEVLSRTTFVDALKSAGVQGSPRPWKDSRELDVVYELALCDFHWIVQFNVIRKLHDEIRMKGESAGRLSGLARAYANLGMLCDYFWSSHDEVFRARALLYAERLIEKSKRSPHALHCRAYVHALVGLPQAALDDLSAAAKLDADSAPAWAPVIREYCSFDAAALQKSAADAPLRPLARMLRLLLLEFGGSAAESLQAAQDLLSAVPDCWRASEQLAQRWELGVKAGANQTLQEFGAAQLYQRLIQLENLPASVRQLLKDAGVPGDVAAEKALRLAVVRQLRAEGACGRDPAEFSWDLLAQLIEESTFLHSQLLTSLQRDSWAVSADETIDRFSQILADHPAAGYLEALHSVSTRRAEGLQDLVQNLHVRDVDLNEMPLLRLLAALPASPQASNRNSELRNLGSILIFKTPQDFLFHDLCLMVAEQGRLSRTAPALGLLREIAPKAPQTIAATIEYDWQNAAPVAEVWEARYQNHSNVIRALALQYTAQQKLDDAERCYRQLVELTPEHQAYVNWARLRLQRGDREGWRKILDEFLTHESVGLERANVQVMIAQDLMLHGAWNEAESYAEAAAESGAGWALQAAQRCAEGKGDWKKAEQYLRQTAERYASMQCEWYFWCRRHGRGDLEAARELARESCNNQKGSSDWQILQQIAVFHQLEGDLKLALDYVKRAVDSSTRVEVLLHAALLADELGDPKHRDQNLSRLTVLLKPTATAPTPDVSKLNVRFGVLAELLTKALEDTSVIEKQSVQQAMNATAAGEPTFFHYALGKFLLLHDRQEQGIELLKFAAGSPVDCHARTLAGFELRQRKIEETKPRIWEWISVSRGPAKTVVNPPPAKSGPNAKKPATP